MMDAITELGVRECEANCVFSDVLRNTNTDNFCTKFVAVILKQFENLKNGRNDPSIMSIS